MKIMYRTIGVAVVSVALVLTTGCVNPNGTQNNTGTGALMGGAFGALVGAAADHAHPGAGAAIGAAAGVIAGGLIGNMIDQQQQQRLQQQYPQTWGKIQNNDPAYASSQPLATPAPTTAPPSSTTPAVTPPTTTTPVPTTTPQTQPLTVDDIKALASAGVNDNAIEHEIDVSQSKFSQQDIAAAQQANPPIDSTIIAYMQSHSS